MTGEPELTVLSLGGGVQSSTLALMAAAGEIRPMPDYAIFADTQWEPQPVYDHLEWLERQLPFPVRRVTVGDIRQHLIDGTNSTGQSFTSIPVFIRSRDGHSTSIARRQCTREYKLQPIEQELLKLIGVGYRQPVPTNVFVELWIGISSDEVMRMKDSRQRWIQHRWPLVEDKLSRGDCGAWFAERYPGRALPRSACIGCPYHTDAEWRQMRRYDGESWRDAVHIDQALRQTQRAQRFGGEMYLHKSRLPLDEVPLGVESQQLSLFGDECEGMCGV